MPDVIPLSQKSTHVSLSEGPAWPLWTRLLFRFSFSYLALSVWFWLFEFSDKSRAFFAKPYWAIWSPLARWTARYVFHWSGAVEPNFVRDTRYLYALLACFLLIAAVGTVVWSVLDRKRMQYIWLNHWMRIFLRYVLAYLLLHYGMDKVFLLQFPAPSLARLTERFGDYSPSSLMWAFIGSSAFYTIFGGVAEILGAVLLLSRRTTTLGALIGFAVMFNVTVMDFSYDVAVKLFCLNILLMALYLIAPDTKRLLHFFFLNRATEPVVLEPVGVGNAGRKVAGLVKILVILFLLIPLTLRDWKSYRTTGAGAPHPPLYGLYEVKELTLAGVVRPPLLTDTARWRSVIFEEPNMLGVKHMDDSVTNYRMQYDPASRTITISAPGDVADKSSLIVVDQSPDGMNLQGTFSGVPVLAKVHRIDVSSFTLVNRGFHWINENSFVR